MAERQIGVRTVHIVAKDEQERVQQSVACPKAGGTVALAECTKCELHRGARLQDNERRSHITCAFESPLPKEPAVPSVADVMTRTPVCVREDVGLPLLIALFVERGISGTPVVDAEARPLGVVTISDLVKYRYDQLEATDGFTGSTMLGFTRPGDGKVPTAGQLMSPAAVTLREDGSVVEAAALMARRRIKRLPVVDASSRVVGILSSLDVMRWLGKQAGYPVG